MNELLDLALRAHGGLEQWQGVRSLDVTFNFSGGLLDLKGFPGYYTPTVNVDARKPHTVLRDFFKNGDVGFYTPDRVWIESADGKLVEERRDPRGAFKGHVRETPWDRLHFTYFIGYAMSNYLTTPFIFALPGFQLRELEEHREGLDTWRVLEVTFPPEIPAHTTVQKFYFDSTGALKRLDYMTDVLGGVAAHYCFDPKQFGGLTIPTFRRVVRRTPEGPLVSGPTSFKLDYTAVKVHRD